MSDTLIFTEAFGCGKILKVALKSFHEHHNRHVHILGTQKDFDDLGEIKEHPNNIFILADFLAEKFKRGHEGTAEAFALVLYANKLASIDMVLSESYMNVVNVIHFDSDVYFKKESVSLIENAFNEGYDIVGSRRCYKNNPAGIVVDPSLSDTVSTYFFGIRRTVIPQEYDMQTFSRMCQGAFNPLGFSVMDFFDPVTFVCLKNGAKIKFIDSNLIGGQDKNGSKINMYDSNLHLDMGYHLAHFGGVGSGYVYNENPEGKNVSYGSWAIGRLSLFNLLFKCGINVNYPCGETKLDPAGRWVSGEADAYITSQITQDLWGIPI